MIASGQFTIALLISLSVGDLGPSTSPDGPSWNDVRQTVQTQLARRPGYQPGDLLTRSDASTILDELDRCGWRVANRSELLGLTLDDSHALVRALRTPGGTRYARAVASQPQAFDRLDRLSQYPGGEKLIHSMIELPGGNKLMQRKPTPGFGDLTSLLPKQANGRTPRDADFNKPTGRIYTESQFLQALEKSWQAKK